MTNRALTIFLIVFVAGPSASLATPIWAWSSNEAVTPAVTPPGYLLTDNNGAKAIVVKDYLDNGLRKVRSFIVSAHGREDLLVHEYADIFGAPSAAVFASGNDLQNPCVTLNADYLHVLFAKKDQGNWYPVYSRRAIPSGNWGSQQLSEGDDMLQDSMSLCVTAETSADGNDLCVFHSTWQACSALQEDPLLVLWRSLNNGNGSFEPEAIDQVVQGYRWPSLAAPGGRSDKLYMTFGVGNPSDAGDSFTVSTDQGSTWSTPADFVLRGPDLPGRSCIAAVGETLFAAFQYRVEQWRSQIFASYRTDYLSWIATNPPYTSDCDYNSPNASMVYDGANCNVIVAAEVRGRLAGPGGEVTAISVRSARMTHEGSPWLWRWAREIWLPNIPSYTGWFDSLNPSVATCVPASALPPIASCVWADHRDGPSTPSVLYRSVARWVDPDVPMSGPVHGTGRRLIRTSDGLVEGAAEVWPHVVSGPVLDSGRMAPMLAGIGYSPALALDGADGRWVVYIGADTLWCMLGNGSYKAVYAGSSSAAPGQPSIVCYPNQANGVYVANVVFPVYDAAGAASMIMYARVDTGGVVLDTIESVANLGDSLPCISVFRGDTLLVTWQHGDSTVASMLCDYGPGTSGRPAAWTSPNLVTANGYHAMSRFDDNGTVLNVVWTRNNGSNYAVQRATCDLATTTFGNWSQMATPGDTGAAEKANPVFGGLGVSCWQEKDNGKWIIKGFVRGEEETFVDNDTDAYHPHAVAESSAVSPSIDQVRVHLLYTAGVTFEVDSGVLDTGETRYVCESLNLSRATSDATKYNNGAKFVRKNGLDSIFSVYSDQDNAVVFAWSANGDTWQRSVIASGRDYPAIAEDSSGKRWIVMRKPGELMNPPIQEAYYRNGSSWTGPETLYSVSGTTLGPASLSGASDTSSGIAYAAFISTASGGSQSLVLAKFNGTNVSTYTVATGTSLGDPSITVEPYLADSDHIHVTWTDNGTLKYAMDTDGRSSSIANNWTSVYALTGQGIVASHPYINSDADQIVVAWAQGTTTDIYHRKRLTTSAYNNWDAAANLSNTANDASDYPTVAMGDTVLVAWQEARTGGSDLDVLVSINFGDTLNVADNATFSSYPHVLFQNKASGDTAIPYVHTIWAETPSANYYEVGYNKLNLKESEGEGGQTASMVPIPTKAVLNACSPNPFRGRTQISYALPTSGRVSLQVFDVTGRTVRTLATGHQKAGNYSVSWDARDSHGKQVPYGVYFYRLDTPGFRAVKKAVVAR